jgi:hypothetical protein
MLYAIVACSPDGDDAPADLGVLPITVGEWLLAPCEEPIDAEPLGLAQISYTPMAPRTNSIDFTLTDLRGWSEPLKANHRQSQLLAVAAWIASNSIGGT